ncbi:hypothetical protein GCM10014713_23750 [Streptomyces purpureus]|uniref:Uncharacterized protein n=1 Tax=Streptomyces purpureus TaxID=1951 RepID=A0A918H2J3_9ACTN|nr:hypothetical protein GCM10014713_23750 [Streptomyces purpureus]
MTQSDDWNAASTWGAGAPVAGTRWLREAADRSPPPRTAVRFVSCVRGADARRETVPGLLAAETRVVAMECLSSMSDM